MSTLTIPVRRLVCLAATLSLLGFLPLRLPAGETARSIGSLTPDQRNHLPDNTPVAVPGRGTVTLGILRAEHRARMQRFSSAGVWGKRVADKLPKPVLAQQQGVGSKASATSAQPQQKPNGGNGLGGGISNSGGNTVITQGSGTFQNPSALGPSGNGGGSKTSATSATQTQQKPSGGNGLGGGISNSGSNGTVSLANKQAIASNSGNGGNGLGGGISGKSGATTAFSKNLFLVPLEEFKGPIPSDYVAFCNGAHASACIYLPPNSTLLGPRRGGLGPNFNISLNGQADDFVADIDPLITDASTCASYGGSLDAAQQCEFYYPFVQYTKFKPAGTPSTAVNCGAPSDYQINAKGGTILAEYSLPYNNPTITTGAAPVVCVVQAWMSP